MNFRNTLSRRHLRFARADDAETPQSGKVAKWFIGAMAFVGFISLLIGISLQEPDWRWLLQSVSCLVTGLGFVAIGLLEVEWLEHVIGFVDLIYSGVLGWIGIKWFGTLSDSELVGRKRAVVIWVVCGFPIFVLGCLTALRVVH